jgi:hypothetical protein
MVIGLLSGAMALALCAAPAAAFGGQTGQVRASEAGAQKSGVAESEQQEKAKEQHPPLRHEEEVVVTASKIEQQLVNAPATVSSHRKPHDKERAGAELRGAPSRGTRPERRADLGAGPEPHEPRRDRHAVDFATGAARRAKSLPGLLRLRRLGLPSDQLQ